MDAPIAITYPGLGNLPDPLHQNGLPGPSGTVVIGRSVNQQSLAGTPDADPPNHPNLVNHQSLPDRPYIFGASRPVASPCPATGRQRAFLVAGSPPRAALAASSPTASARHISCASCRKRSR